MKKLLLLCVCFLLCACSQKDEGTKPEKKEETSTPVVSDIKDEYKDVSFTAVGDNLIHGAIYYYNNNGDGTYNLQISMRIPTSIHKQQISLISIKKQYVEEQS